MTPLKRLGSYFSKAQTCITVIGTITDQEEIEMKTLKKMQKAAVALSIVSLGGLTASAMASQTQGQERSQVETRAEELKAKIVAIASENTLNSVEELPATREKLQPLVEELLSLSTDQSLGEELAAIEGGWKELWSDDREVGRPGTTIDRESIYQFVTGVGVFYNIGVSTSPRGTITTFLRGQYQDSQLADGLFITFTDVSFIPNTLDPGKNLESLIDGLEDQTFATQRFPFDLTVPRGPIGARGFLETLYVDSDVRIASGYNFADKKIDLYVLERAQSIQ